MLFAVFAFSACEEPEPPPPSEITRFQYVSGAFGHSMALDKQGNIWTWGGEESAYRLGHGYNVRQKRPLMITQFFSSYEEIFNPPIFTQISAGTRHSMALDREGNIWTWGQGGGGALGHGNALDQNLPQMISFVYLDESENEITIVPRFIGINAGNGFSMAICGEGNIWAWGQGNYRPRKITQFYNHENNLPTFTELSIRDWHNMALDSDGNIWTWGSGVSGALGHGDELSKNIPKKITLVFLNESGYETTIAPKFTQVSAGNDFSMAICDEGNIWMWGGWWYFNHSNEQIGHGSHIQPSHRPRRITQFYNYYDEISSLQHSGIYFISISANISHSMAICNENNIWTWGSGWYGELGHGGFGRRYYPRRIRLVFLGSGYELFGAPRFQMISGGNFYSLAICGENNIWAWGSNTNHQLGLERLGLLRPMRIVM